MKRDHTLSQFLICQVGKCVFSSSSSKLDKKTRNPLDLSHTHTQRSLKTTQTTISYFMEGFVYSVKNEYLQEQFCLSVREIHFLQSVLR